MLEQQAQTLSTYLDQSISQMTESSVGHLCDSSNEESHRYFANMFSCVRVANLASVVLIYPEWLQQIKSTDDACSAHHCTSLWDPFVEWIELQIIST